MRREIRRISLLIEGLDINLLLINLKTREHQLRRGLFNVVFRGSEFQRILVRHLVIKYNSRNYLESKLGNYELSELDQLNGAKSHC